MRSVEFNNKEPILLYTGSASTTSRRSSRRNTGQRSDDDGRASGANTPLSTSSADNAQHRLEEALDHIDRLENEREEMLESLCKQAETNNTLKDEIEDLKNGGECGVGDSGDSGRPSSRSAGNLSISSASGLCFT